MTPGAWLFLLALFVLLFPLWYALIVATIKVSIANPVGALLAVVIYGGPVLGGFLVGRSFRNEYLRRRAESRARDEEIAAIRAELDELRRSSRAHR
jgi:hypothetical protein